jgi:hypothetical protein
MTNEEIQVGEYVRTKSGKIGKVLDITNVTMQKRKKYLIKWDISTAYYISLNIVKHSPNIIDLIEVGDYVNGLKVYDIEKAENMVTKKDCIAINMQNLGSTILYEKSIKSIVTKEQFKSMEYEVEEDDKC